MPVANDAPFGGSAQLRGYDPCRVRVAPRSSGHSAIVQPFEPSVLAEWVLDGELRALADRPGWTVDEKAVAIYAPSRAGWRAVVRVPVATGRMYER